MFYSIHILFILRKLRNQLKNKKSEKERESRDAYRKSELLNGDEKTFSCVEAPQWDEGTHCWGYMTGPHQL